MAINQPNSWLQLLLIDRLSHIACPANCGASNGATFLSGLAYNAASEPTGFAYGNNITASFAYNSRLQLQELAYRNGATDLFKLTYNYGTGNNGQIQSITDNVDSSRSMAYTYDAWNRVKTTTAGPTASPTWKLSWDYDRFGNRKNQNLVQGTGYQVLLSISESTNRITSPGYAYDASGNLTNDTLHSYTFDAENRITQVDGGTTATNSYDGSGLRVKKTVGANTTRYIFSGTKVIAEYLNGSLNAEYIYAGSQLLATLSSTGVPTYQHPDHLSTRVSTDTAGNIVRTFGSYPFGETWYETGAANKWKFTSYERDSESFLDYAMFRFDSSRLGRFQTPDPLGGTIRNPQSLNRYAYVRNDPIGLVDPLGLCTFEWTTTCFTWPTGQFCFTVMSPCTGDNATGVDAESALRFLASAGGGGGGGKRERFQDTSAEDKGDGGDPGTFPKADCKEFVPPVGNARITSPFGDPRPEGPHKGVDFGVPSGTSVAAPFSGTVAFAGWLDGFGNLVIISNAQGSSLLAHLSSINKTDIYPGAPVQAGARIGRSGATGNARGPHLHFEQHGPGPVFDPKTGKSNSNNLLQPCLPKKN